VESPTRKVRYSVAMSLDGFIADPRGGYDWIIMDPAIDFGAFLSTVDTVLMGRRTFEVAMRQGPEAAMPGMRRFVFSRTLRAADHPDVTVVADNAAPTVAALRAEDGNDIWLMGGGVLFKSLLDAGVVDTVEVGVVPVLLGAGIPLLPGASGSTRLALTKAESVPSGVILLKYAVRRAAGH
jgi:dihydrofolate reductase